MADTTTPANKTDTVRLAQGVAADGAGPRKYFANVQQNDKIDIDHAKIWPGYTFTMDGSKNYKVHVEPLAGNSGPWVSLYHQSQGGIFKRWDLTSVAKPNSEPFDINNPGSDNWIAAAETGYPIEVRVYDDGVRMFFSFKDRTNGNITRVHIQMVSQ